MQQSLCIIVWPLIKGVNYEGFLGSKCILSWCSLGFYGCMRGNAQNSRPREPWVMTEQRQICPPCQKHQKLAMHFRGHWMQNGPGIATGIEEQWQPHSFLQEPGAAASVSAVASPARARRWRSDLKTGAELHCRRALSNGQGENISWEPCECPFQSSRL